MARSCRLFCISDARSKGLAGSVDSLAVIGNGSVVVAFSAISDAPVVKGASVVGIQSDRLAGGRDSSVIVTAVESCGALARQGRVARSCLCFSLFAPLFLRLRSGEPLLLGFRSLALCFGFGGRLGLALLFCLSGS